MTDRDQKRILWAFLGFIAVLLIAMYLTGNLSAYAQSTAIVTPEAVAVVPPNTTVEIPWGAWLSELSSALATVIFGAIVWGMRRLPSNISAILQTMRAEQLMQNAINYGMNAVAGASKDKVLSVPIANDVVRKVVEYAVANGAPRIVEWMGGENGIAAKTVARLDVESSSEVPGPVIADPALPLFTGDHHSVMRTEKAGPISTNDIIPKGDF